MPEDKKTVAKPEPVIHTPPKEGGRFIIDRPGAEPRKVSPYIDPKAGDALKEKDPAAAAAALAHPDNHNPEHHAYGADLVDAARTAKSAKPKESN